MGFIDTSKLYRTKHVEMIANGKECCACGGFFDGNEEALNDDMTWGHRGPCPVELLENLDISIVVQGTFRGDDVREFFASTPEKAAEKGAEWISELFGADGQIVLQRPSGESAYICSNDVDYLCEVDVTMRGPGGLRDSLIATVRDALRSELVAENKRRTEKMAESAAKKKKARVDKVVRSLSALREEMAPQEYAGLMSLIDQKLKGIK